MVKGQNGRWFEIHKSPRTKEKENHNYVGTARAKGFGPALRGVYVEGFVENEDVGDKNS